MKNILFLFFVIILILSCKKETNKPSIITIKTEDNIKKKLPQKKPIKKNIVKKVIKKEKIIIDDFMYPKFNKSMFRLSRPDLYYEKPINNKLNNWYGLFYYKKLNKHYISKTKLKLDKIQDHFYDYSVKTNNKDKCLLLMSGFFLPEIEIIEEKIVSRLIFPGDTINFNFLNKEYTLYATGIKRKMEGQPKMFYSYNYKLFLTTKKNNRLITTLLVAVPSPDPFVTITFMGDIDGDKKLDLIINGSGHYATTKLILYLSRFANEKENLKVMGIFEKSCC